MGSFKQGRKIKVLVTAGPTWVGIDEVRVFTNIFSGRTGLSIANVFKKRGFSVTVLLGPSPLALEEKELRIIRFKYFDELRSLVKKELSDRQYRAVVHTAAVSDYRPVETFKGKLGSLKKELNLKLVPTPKIIQEIRTLRPDIFLIQFKLEAGLLKKDLLETAHKSLLKNNSDIVVANDLKVIRTRNYKAYVIDRAKNVRAVASREKLAQELVRIVREFC